MFWLNSKTASLPFAILHIDGDAFFASCEQAVHPELKGKPVVTGKERGIVSAASYEAKALGIQRGVRLSDVYKICPNAVIVPSDYETYSLFSKRMFSIMRRFSSVVEEYGIDEGFVDITGMRRPLNMSYPQIAEKIKKIIQNELDITVSVGLASTKVLAKFASKFQKPNGLTIIRNNELKKYLSERPMDFVWGIGANTHAHLYSLGTRTAYDFACMPEERVMAEFTKPLEEIWHELNGRKIYEVIAEEKQTYASISKTKTFTPPSRMLTFIFSQLVKNMENACIKARRYNLVSTRLAIFLKTQDFKTSAVELDVHRASAYPNELMSILKLGFDELFVPGELYRATGVTLSGLKENIHIQANLFESSVQLQKMKRIYVAVDRASARFGKHTIHLGASLSANVLNQHGGDRGEKSSRKSVLMKGETHRQRVAVPMVFMKLK